MDLGEEGLLSGLRAAAKAGEVHKIGDIVLQIQGAKQPTSALVFEQAFEVPLFLILILTLNPTRPSSLTQTRN